MLPFTILLYKINGIIIEKQNNNGVEIKIGISVSIVLPHIELIIIKNKT